METFIEQMKEEIRRQSILISETISRNLMNVMEEKFNKMIEENKKLKLEVTNLRSQINTMESSSRRNNLIVYGITETEKNITDLFNKIDEILQTNMKIKLEKYCVNKIYRLGNKTNRKEKPGEKPRPILISFTTIWNKLEILKNKKKLPDHIYILEDFPNDVLEKRRSLISQMREERQNGKYAYIKYDKLIVKDYRKDNEGRKRKTTTPTQDKQVTNKTFESRPAKKIIKCNAFERMRSKRDSKSETTD